LPCIKVRKNSRVIWKKGDLLRNLSVLAQRNDLQKWKDRELVMMDKGGGLYKLHFLV